MEKMFKAKSHNFYYACQTSLNGNWALISDNHCHGYYELLYIAQGVGRCIVEGREYPVRPSTLIIIPPFEYHHVELDSAVSVYERTVINFSEGDLLQGADATLRRLVEENRDRGCFYPSHALGMGVVSILSRMEDAKELAEQNRVGFIQLALSQLIYLLSVTRVSDLPESNEELGARVMKYLNEHIERDVSLDKLSKRFFVSKYYLCRAFKKRNGISIHGYVNQKRVIYAKHLIDSGEAASVAAYKVGFGDYSAFYRAYVKIIGTAPTAEAGRRERVDGENT